MTPQTTPDLTPLEQLFVEWIVADVNNAVKTNKL